MFNSAHTYEPASRRRVRMWSIGHVRCDLRDGEALERSEAQLHRLGDLLEREALGVLVDEGGGEGRVGGLVMAGSHPARRQVWRAPLRSRSVNCQRRSDSTVPAMSWRRAARLSSRLSARAR